MNYQKQFRDAIELLKSQNRYREFIEITRKSGEFPRAYNYKTKQDIIVWCGNDYLGMGQNPLLADAMYQGLKEYGAGAGGTRNISGNHHPLVQLESTVAKLHAMQAGLVFSSGYIANQSTISTLAKILDNLVILSDSCNHASIIEGIKHAKCDKIIFKHNDLKSLEDSLKLLPQERAKLIVFESVYSMNGNIAPVKEIIALAKKYNALTYVDEVHALGLYGDDGVGIISKLNLKSDIDILQATFAKACGLIGGYIVSTSDIVDSIRSYAPGFIFTTAMSPAIANAALASLNHIVANKSLRTRFFDNVLYS